MKIVLARVIAPDRALFSGPHQRRQEEKLGVVRVSFKAQVTCISWHMCALRGNEKRSAWECKSKDAPQTERNAIDAQNEGAAGQRTKNNTRKSSGRGAHRADLLSAYRAWRKVVRATRPERVVLFAPPTYPQAFRFCHPAQKQQRRAFLQSLRGSMASAFAPPPPPPPADSADSAPVQDGKQKYFFFLPPGSLCWDRTINGSRAACSLCPVLLCF